MADEKKPGFFKRLFGFGKAEPVPEALPVPEPVVAPVPDAAPLVDEAGELIAREIAEAKAEAETARIAAEKTAAKRIAEDKAAVEKVETERLAAEDIARKTAAEKALKERAEAERIAGEKKAAAQAEADRVEAEKAEAARLEADRIEEARQQALIEEARLARELIERERVEAERQAVARQAETDRLAAEEAVRDQAAKLETEKEKAEREQADLAEAARIAAEKAAVEQAVAVVVPDRGIPALKVSWWQKLKGGLSRTASNVSEGITGLFTKRKLDGETLEELEDLLIQADLGIDVAARISSAVGKGRYDKEIEPDEVKAILAEEVAKVLAPVAMPLVLDPAQKPYILLMVGVNGSGKTTTIGKLASKFRAEGKSVMLAAGDTFRAAAIEQLKVWGERTGAKVIAREQGGDAAGLAFDAVKAAREQNVDVLMVDTAGRLQNRTELMAELEKVVRVIKKLDDTAPHGVLLVLDATVGQNALSQVEIFGKTAGVTGLVMTKLDGTARGGILVAIAEKFKMPIHFIGVGEGVDDLEPFAAQDFARAIAGLDQIKK